LTVSIWSASSRLLPTLWPCAARNVNIIPPPTRILSARGSRCSITPEKGVELILPVDAVMASGFAADADHVVAAADALEDTPFGADGMGLDIGPETAKIFADAIRGSKTVADAPPRRSRRRRRPTGRRPR
jgi:hypothetical protein